MGGGGHTKAILDQGGRVIALDQDPDAILYASSRLQKYILEGRLDIIQTNFRFINDAVSRSRFFERPASKVDGILMDLGISSHQIDQDYRGFAFGVDGPLDMRMSRGETSGSTSLSASNIVNEWDVEQLANCLYNFGDETRSRQIARQIVTARPLNSTGQLVDVISRITSFKQRPQTLARCFQAIRIAVNDEIGALENALESVYEILKPGGRLVIISYHSLEDRRVKNLFKYGSVGGEAVPGTLNVWNPLFKGAQLPTEEEIARNRRARSAKLRVAERRSDQEALQLVQSQGIRQSKSFVGAKQIAKAFRNGDPNDSS